MTVQQSFELALQHHQAGRLTEAEALYRQVLAVQPHHADALHRLGVIAHQAGRHDLAIELIGRAIALHPNDPAAHSNLGEANRAMGRLDEAAIHYRRALELKSDHPRAHNNLGIVLWEQGRLDEAIAAFRRAIELKPHFAAAHVNLGNALRTQSRFDEAVAACRRALEIDPHSVEARNNLGAALAEQGQLDSAMDCYREALRLQPNSAETHYNLGEALRKQSHLEEAIASYRRALELQPRQPEAWNNLGNAFVELGQYQEAAAAFRRVLELQPDSGNAQFNYANLVLLWEDFEHGWPLYEARWHLTHGPRRSFSDRMWEGEPLQGRRVLVHAEQGLGDSIQFIRYAGLIAECGGEAVVACPPSLVELFRSAQGVHEVVAAGDPLPPFDRQVAMLSQPFVFRTTAQTIPREVPYLFADENRREAWRERLGRNRSRRRVGLVWAGDPNHFALRKRHVGLELLLPLLQVNAVDFFSLQIGPGAEQLPGLSAAAAIVDHTGHIHDFADTAAFLAELDLVISVDTAVAHLAGALARPVWTLLPFVPDWRWGLAREDTPWYPTMRLFRQPALGDWASVIQRVAGELSRAAATGSVGSLPAPC